MRYFDTFNSLGSSDYEDGPWIQGDFRVLTLEYQRIEDSETIREFVSVRVSMEEDDD